MASPARLRIDWDKNGNFTSAGDDVTDHVRGPVVVSYGRDQGSATEPTTAGRGSIKLDNNAPGAVRRYSPGNASSTLAGKLKPGRPVLFERTVLGTTYTIFRGQTDDQPLNPDIDDPTVSLTLVDSLAGFRRPTLSTALYQGLRSGEVVDLILDEIGWTGGRDIDSGASVFPWWWEEGATAFDALAKVVASDGAPALLTMGPAGEVVFRDRHHRLRLAASTTSQQTWRGQEDSAEPVMGKGFLIDYAWRNVVNQVSITVDERKRDAFLSQVWSTDEVITLGASASDTFVVQTSDPFADLDTPVEDVDYVLISGAVASITTSRDSGASTSVTVTATGAGAKLQGLALRGKSVPVKRQWQLQKSDATSITDYEPMNIPSHAEPVWASRYDARALADLYVLQRKQPLSILSVRFVCGVGDDARLAKLLARDLSDRVTVIEPMSGTSGDFFIESIRHEYNGPEEHVIIFGLEQAPAAPVSSFILGTSTLNGAATLGY